MLFSQLSNMLYIIYRYNFKDRVKSTDNTSTKRQGQKYRQHIHQKTKSKVQTTHPPKDRVKSTDNTSTKRQGCCLYFSPCPLVDVLSVPITLSFGGCVVCTFHLVPWWMCCLYLLPCHLVDVLSTFDPFFWWMCCLYS
jgi:hypothetical protein